MFERLTQAINVVKNGVVNYTKGEFKQHLTPRLTKVVKKGVINYVKCEVLVNNGIKMPLASVDIVSITFSKF